MAYNNSSYIQPWCYNRSISPDGSPEEKLDGKRYESPQKNCDEKIEDMETQQDYMKRWRKNNKERIREYKRQWRERKKEKDENHENNKFLKESLEKEIKIINEEIKKNKNEIDEKFQKIKKLEERRGYCLKLLK